MSSTLTLLGRWPSSCKHSVRTEIPKVCEQYDVYEEVFSSSVKSGQALMDAVDDGEIPTACKNSGLNTCLLWVCNDNEPERGTIDELSTFFDENIQLSNVSELTSKYNEKCKNSEQFICIVLASQPAIGALTESSDNKRASAASVITQTLAARAALQDLEAIAKNHQSKFAATAYHALEFRKNNWRGCPDSFAILSKDILPQSSLLSPLMIAQTLLCATNVLDDVSDVQIKKLVTLYEDDKGVEKCVTRVIINNKRYDLTCTPPEAKSLSDIPALFVSYDDRLLWRVKDPKNEVFDLLEDEEWAKSNTASVLMTESFQLVKQIVVKRIKESGESIPDFLQGENEVETQEEDEEEPPEEEHEFEDETSSVVDTKEEEPLWLQEASQQISPAPDVDVHSDSEKSSDLSWVDKIRGCIHEQFGFENMESAAVHIEALNPKSAYTMLISNDDMVILTGSYTPACLNGVNTCFSTPDSSTQNRLRVTLKNKHCHIGKYNVDTTSYIQCDSMAIYKANFREDNIRKTSNDVGLKGAVKRLELRMQLGKGVN